MRSLQNNYNLITEGKGSKELFMKQVRREFPQYISNVQTFDQAVTKLKEKSIISENTTSNITAPIKDVNWFNIFQENLNEVKATEKKTSKEVEEVQSKAYDYSDLGNMDNVFGQEFLTGYYAEMKDPKNAEKTEEDIKKIVAKNLAKDELYYVKDGQFGVKGLGYVETPTKEAEGEYKSSGYGTIKESYNEDLAEEEIDEEEIDEEEIDEEGLMDLEKLIGEVLSSKV